MPRYVPKTVREYGRIYLAERLAELGWQCFIARRSPNEDEVTAGIPEQEREIRLKFHSQENRQAVRFYDADSLDWEWQYLVISTHILAETPVTYLLSRNDIRVEGRLEEEFEGALWLQPDAFSETAFQEAWHKLDE
jgi:hypothetical protein